MRSNVFYTLFVVVYYPICLLLYYEWNFDYSDEILTALLVAYFCMQSKKTFNKEFCCFLLIMMAYVAYSIFIAITSVDAIFYDLQQQVKPYLIFYATFAISPQFTTGQCRFLRKWVLFCYVLYFISIIPHIIENLGYDRAEFSRNSIVCALLYYYFSTESRRAVIITLLIMTSGLLSLKSKFFGEYILMVALFLLVKKKVNFKSVKAICIEVILLVVVLFFTWTKFSFYYIEGFKDSSQELARPISYITSLKIFVDYFPFGSGFATFSSNAAGVYYSPLYYKYNIDGVWGVSPDNPAFLADAFYPLLAQFGIVGVLLFCVFWRRRFSQIQNINMLKYYRLAIMASLCLLIESVGDTSYLSSPGIAYFLILALCLRKI